MEKDGGWRSLIHRHGRQIGRMNAILRTKGGFDIYSMHKGGHAVALQISRNLYQYFSAGSRLYLSGMQPTSTYGNIITVSLHPESPPSLLSTFPVRICSKGLVVDSSYAEQGQIVYPNQEGLGAICLRPLADECLELFIWGYDEAGLRRAARLLPMLTGVGQPDFVILSKECAWKGIGGVLAMGFFDSFWKISAGSYLTR